MAKILSAHFSGIKKNPIIFYYFKTSGVLRPTFYMGQLVSQAHQLHVVDQGVAVLPGLLGVAAQGGRLDVLGPVQLTQGRGEQQGRVVHQRRLRL